MNTRTPLIEAFESVVLPPSLQQKMLDHAEATLPNECCGVLGGRGRVITSVYPITNECESPNRFFANTRELFEAMRKMRLNNEEMLGIYHSHPGSPAEPSQTDREDNLYPGLFYFIISLEGADPVVRCYVMSDESEFDPVHVI